MLDKLIHLYKAMPQFFKHVADVHVKHYRRCLEFDLYSILFIISSALVPIQFGMLAYSYFTDSYNYARFMNFMIISIGFSLDLLDFRRTKNKKNGMRTSQNPSIMNKAPGNFALRICIFIFPKKINDEIFRQAISDMREEYFMALSNDQNSMAKYILVRDHCNLVLTAISYIATTVVKRAVSIWKIIG